MTEIIEIIEIIEIEGGGRRHHHQHIYPQLVFLHFHKHKKHHKMSIVKSLTLTSLVAQVLKMSVVDQNNNNEAIPGTLSNLVVTSADPAQDTVGVDASDPESVDVDAVSTSGGTTVTATANFTSTKLGPDGTTPVLNNISLTATLTLINSVAANPALVFNQN